MTDSHIAVPNGFFDVLMLAGIIIFCITSFSAILSSVFVKKDNLLYLGTQLILLNLVLTMSAHWTYPLWFSGLFDTVGQEARIILTMLLLSIAFTLDMGLKVIVWEGFLAHQGRRSMPPLLIASARVTVYLFALLVILQFVFDKPITALAALSGALAVIIGLSAQATLGEIFAGIALALSRPFSIGDWVKIGSLEEGRVIDMTWRMVRIETRDLVVLNVPNRSAADNTVHNFTRPNGAVSISETICFPQGENPRAVQQLLDRALANTTGIAGEPRPYALYRGAKQGVSEYHLRFYIKDYEDKETAIENVWQNVTDHIARSGFVIAFPRQHLAIRNENRASSNEVEIGEVATDPDAAQRG